jgi:hypothetical protein
MKPVRIAIINNSLTSWYYGEQTEVAVVGCFENNRLSLVLVPCSDIEDDDPYLPSDIRQVVHVFHAIMKKHS